MLVSSLQDTSPTLGGISQCVGILLPVVNYVNNALEAGAIKSAPVWQFALSATSHGTHFHDIIDSFLSATSGCGQPWDGWSVPLEVCPRSIALSTTGRSEHCQYAPSPHVHNPLFGTNSPSMSFLDNYIFTPNRFSPRFIDKTNTMSIQQVQNDRIQRN